MWLLLVFMLLAWAASRSGDSISDVSILLSYNSTGMSLSVSSLSSEDCWLWKTSVPQLLRLEDREAHAVIEEDQANSFCTADIFVRPIASSHERLSAMVFATSAVTGNVLHCEVFVDHIHSLRLLTTMRKLILDEMEVLRVQALDFSDNVFSSLRGVPFDWSVDDATILALLPLASAEANLDLSEFGLDEFSDEAEEEMDGNDVFVVVTHSIIARGNIFFFGPKKFNESLFS